MVDRLWAGWRMSYIREAAAAVVGPAECLFCELARRGPGPESLVLETYSHCFLTMNAFPYTSGHLMVAPYAHHVSFLGSSPGERGEMQAALERARHALDSEYGPDGFNVGVNLGPAAGAGVVGHLHWHLVPRWNGDTNFMPALAEVRVLPEALGETYARLLRALAAAPAEGLEVTGRGDVG